jgi:peroxiredoxin
VDKVEAQKKHAINCAATFPILSDVEKTLTSELGILRDTGTAARTTYVIDGSGTVRRVFSGVTVDGHVDEVLRAVRELQS